MNNLPGSGKYTIVIKNGSHRIGPVKDDTGVVIKEGLTLSKGKRFLSQTDLSQWDSAKFANADHAGGVGSITQATDDELKAELNKRSSTEEVTNDSLSIDSELNEMELNDLKSYADEVGVKHPNNISKENLIKKISDSLS